MKYRSDIDGLRAVAVLPVVGFHYQFMSFFPGGFVGVDVFFVISGFLITKIIYDDFESGKYSIVDFYNRRVRRIFPALFVMFFAILIMSYATQFSSEIDYVGKSIISSVFFVSNVFFYNSAGYFDGGLSSNPVLHTWSLSVEEQFYIIFPIIMSLLRSISAASKKRILTVLTLLSFSYSIMQTYIESTAAFYLVQSRAWELMLGGLVAIGVFPNISHRYAIDAIGVAGLSAIVFAVVLYSETTPFPGLAAVLPCFGAAAIIYSGGCGRGLVYQCLSMSPLRFIGLISYSLYLWHWPLFVYASHLAVVGRWEKVGLAIIAVAVSTASYYFVERPFRQKPFQLTRVGTLGAAATAMATFTIVAVSLGSVAESIHPTPVEARRVLSYEHYDAASMREGECFLTSRFKSFASFSKDKCLNFVTDKKNVLIFGDSHAAHLWPGYNAVYPNVNFLQATASGCKPVEKTEGEKRCTDLVNYIIYDYLQKVYVDTIILSARWKNSDIIDVLSSVDRLKKHARLVVILGPIEEYSFSLPRILANSILKNRNVDEFAHKYLRSDQQETDRIFSSSKFPDGVMYISVYSAMCKATCRLWAQPSIPLQFDYGHLTKEGSAELAKVVGSRFLDSPTNPPIIQEIQERGIQERP
jgi:peptidoglycan/LPS O-acetylase OafA/YrhL